jgi:hypothetical protein
MNTFAEELRELIDKYRDMPGYALEEIVDGLEAAVEGLVDEVNARASA